MQWVLGNIPFTKVLLYSAAQTAGAFLGAVITFITYYGSASSH